MVNKLKTIKPLIIGIGVAGKRHLEAQVNLGIKTGVYTINPEKIKALKKQTGVIVFDNLHEAISWSNLVHVCTPDDKHTEFVALALKKRKAVLCEKSFTTNLQDALDLQDLAHKYNPTLIVGQNYRLTPTFMETRKRVLGGILGTITGIETTYLHDMAEYKQRTPLRKNQDFLYIAGSHAVDLACWVVNKQIVSVQAAIENNKRLEYDCPKTYQIICKFSSGLLGHIKLDASSARPRSGTDLIVDGENGQLVSHNKQDQLLFYRKGNKKLQSIKLLNSQAFTIALEVKIIDDYLSGKSTSHWPLPKVDEAVDTIKVIDAIQKAALSGRNEHVT